MAERIDIVIFGATGFTGKKCIPEIEKFSKIDGKTLTWGVSGRSQQKLEQVLEEMGKVMNKDLKNIPIIVADVNDEESLKNMTAKAKLILNCCGPYRFFGEPVIKACVETGTHHLDVSGEPQFIETMQLKYSKACKEKGIYIISACGFDSIPNDLGLVFLEKNFDGTLNSVETYLEGGYEGGSKAPGPVANYGTWQSLVHGIAHSGELRPIRRQLYPQKMPSLTPKLKSRGFFHKYEGSGKWALPFLGSDRSVMTRTQRFLYEWNRKRPVQVQTYFTLGSLIEVFCLGIMAGIIGLMSKFEFGRNLLLKYPSIFTLGYFSTGGPSEETMQKTSFSITLHGEGWAEKLAEPEDNFNKPPNKMAVARVSGTNPGYGVTCTSLVLAGITILTEKDKLPKDGGVYPPGAAFANTSLIEKLNKNGLKFEILTVKEAKRD